MNHLAKSFSKNSTSAHLARNLFFAPKRAYHFPPSEFGMVHVKPGLTAKRIIRCVGERLRRIDPLRWESVPITFKTHFRDENGFADLYTCAHIHDAIEREFFVEVKDRQVLITDIETAFAVVNQSHESI